jgi:hypothetical protein
MSSNGLFVEALWYLDVCPNLEQYLEIREFVFSYVYQVFEHVIMQVSFYLNQDPDAVWYIVVPFEGRYFPSDGSDSLVLSALAHVRCSAYSRLYTSTEGPPASNVFPQPH